MAYEIDVYTVKEQFREAIRRWNNGESYKCFTDISDTPSYGYGELDNNGFWDYPFPNELAELDIIAAENKLRHKLI